ncbi:MAG: hypothetical protein QOF02_2291 [Blastocatellia bacterium]|nr:hypothetical protein [Blastocatellia bacterium]
MNSKPLIKCMVRLFALALMLGALMVVSSEKNVKASDDCGFAYGSCQDNCNINFATDATQRFACLQGCDSSYADCIGDEPNPYPVVSRYRMCISACMSMCGNPLNDDGTGDPNCFPSCKADCINNYGWW